MLIYRAAMRRLFMAQPLSDPLRIKALNFGPGLFAYKSLNFKDTHLTGSVIINERIELRS
jgi:hypothetical protein